MLFRPEEVHVGSPVSAARAVHPEGSGGVSHDRVRLDRHHLLVAHNDNHGCPAVQAGSIHPYSLSRKEPAHRQRFEPSLGEPFRFPFYGDAILVGQVVKRCNRNDLVGLRMEKE